MRLAYADPPYLGCAHLYPEHPESEKWDNLWEHVALLRNLDLDYDGWAYSLSVPSLRDLLYRSPEGTRVAAWVKPFAAFKRGVRCAYTWEPVLFKPGRDSSADGAPVTRDHLSERITMQRGLVGAKPEHFCRWVLDLLGYIEGDTLDDYFPGTGVMGRVISQGSLVLLDVQSQNATGAPSRRTGAPVDPDSG